MPGFIPPIGTKGVWTLIAPFEALLAPNVPYKNIAVRAIADIVAAGDNPETLYYTPNGLSQQQYETDVQAGVYILTLQNDAGQVVYVPSSYLTSYPNVGGVPYSAVALGVNLGPLPSGYNLSFLKSKIASDVQDYLGVTPEVFENVISATVIVSNQQDAAITAARQAAVGTITTDYAKWLQANAQLQTAAQKIQMLEAYILGTPMSQLPPVCTVTNITPQNNGILPLTGQTVTLQAQTTVGTVQSLQYSVNGGTSWTALTITPAQSITETFNVTVPAGNQTIQFKATDSNNVSSAVESISVIVESPTVVTLNDTVTTWTVPAGVTNLISVSGTGSNDVGTPSTVVGLTFPGVLAGNPLPVTTYANVAVVASTVYQISIPTGATVTITY